MRKNEIEVLVNWGDTDKAGIVYYPNYFKWFDIAGHQFFRSCGLSPTNLEKERQIILPMLDARCTFEKTLLYEDLITIRTTVLEINDKTIKLKHEVFNGEIRTGNGYELRGWVKQTGESIKAVPIPDDVRTILQSNVEKESAVLATTKYNA
ncbi:4-hydroxybenzoyl-CoA thioesterase [Alkalihalobacillus alcalophilus ATCC 27647 = CGMCC 1.3604]|uniref:4-hydroxybenzoyl-CoA thioesterase n=1 Tax=Alkalihalobacillus alcalophilus ATCC 27647 = CGMCC 1.3604 TaxID=1218173 RepID=A0A094XA63_ALKAL|nr:thioesterase family protein [Alkalihalobacillus alcalophilus]KGA95665.1 4-hydroxybenzoyl-CoA thioesterase [Alkalihalobacillus alcalophilus ATCC 27647 = CGMCC 1.3604]MED1563746.1 thioesterase family protein [Alkalihalobacillus alcalophilus]THG92279.1 4-hydroxybenzoyl-CoA thioesterase [Alkalihalobacillus alcalophilus ATCC 27647 = CGMCC 1.3604]